MNDRPDDALRKIIQILVKTDPKSPTGAIKSVEASISPKTGKVKVEYHTPGELPPDAVEDKQESERAEERLAPKLEDFNTQKLDEQRKAVGESPAARAGRIVEARAKLMKAVGSAHKACKGFAPVAVTVKVAIWAGKTLLGL